MIHRTVLHPKLQNKNGPFVHKRIFLEIATDFLYVGLDYPISMPNVKKMSSRSQDA